MTPILDAILRTGGPLAVVLAIAVLVVWRLGGRGISLAREWHEARVAHDTRVLTALEGVTSEVRGLTGELRTSNKDALEHRGRVDARLDRLELSVIKAIGEDGEQTRQVITDRRLSDVARAVEDSVDDPPSRSRGSRR